MGMRSAWLLGLTLLLLAGGCATAKLSSEDLEVEKRFAREIAILHNPDLPPNSRQKYEAAKKLAENVDFTFTTDVSILDKIFSAADARVNERNVSDQLIMFYYQYQNRSVRFLFYRYNNFVTRVEVIEK